MTAIWKHTVPMPDNRGRSWINLPAGARLLSVGIQDDGGMVVWSLVSHDRAEDEMESGPRRLIVVNTGGDIEMPDGARFLGTVDDEGIVWHVFDGDAETTA